ncbi:MAG: AMP-binding protein [Pseudomonadota bacterium]
MIFEPNDRPAIAFKNKELSYRELHENIVRFGEVFTPAPGDRAIIFAENRPEWIYAFYSQWQHQGIVVPVDMFSNAEDVAYILNDSRPAMVFYSSQTSAVLDDALRQSACTPLKVNLDDLHLPEATAGRAEFVVRQEDTAVIIYTSGTTGSPKGVMLSHGNLSAVQRFLLDRGYFVASDKIIAILPFHHIFPLQGTVLIPFRAGAATIILDRLDSSTIMQALQQYRVTILIGVPRLYRMLLDGIGAKIRKSPVASALFGLSKAVGSYSLGKALFKKVQTAFGGSIRFMVCGGSPLDNEILTGFRALGFKILNGYGLTETAPMIANNPPEAIKIGSVGKVNDGVEVKIVDEEIVVRGPIVMQGYYKNREATDAVLRDGWFHTGDKGSLDNNGYLYVTGRIKEIIILPNGKNINPEEVERKVISISPLVKEIGVYQDGDSLSALLVPDIAQAMKEQVVNLQETLRWTVIDAYNSSVPSYRKIRGITIMRDELPKTKLGKLKRFMLKDLAQRTTHPAASIKEPDFEEYGIVKNYLAETVKSGILPCHHLELDLGIDSLGKVELLVFIEKTFGVQLHETRLAEFPHVLALCEHLREAKVQISREGMNWKEILREEISLTLPKRIIILTLCKWIFRPLSRLYFSFEVKGLENIPADAACIFTPNHQSFMDALIVASSLKNSIMKKTFFFAKEKHFRSAFRKLVAQNSNVIVMNINSSLKLALQQTAAVLKSGKNMVIFPEGARSRDGGLMPFKKTFAILSKELNVPIIPVAIKGAFESMSVGSRFPRPGKITLQFLKPLYPQDQDYESLMNQTQNLIRQKL